MEEINSEVKHHIFSINLAIFFLYYICGLLILRGDKQGNALFGLALYIPHAFILFIFSLLFFLKGRNKEAAQFAFTAIALCIIGFGACTFAFLSGTVGIDI